MPSGERRADGGASRIQRLGEDAALARRRKRLRGGGAGVAPSFTKISAISFSEIDLAGIETVDASGLGLLVELQHWATLDNRILYFTHASGFVSRLVVLTRLYNVLVIAPGAGRISREPAPALTA